MELFQNKYRIPTARLSGYDYGSDGMYFITICTQDRLPYFVETQNLASPDDKTGTVEPQNFAAINGMHSNNAETQNIASLRYSALGKIAAACWTEIPKHFPFVELDEFIVMPNHVHGILFFNKPEYRDWKPNRFGPQSQNLASVIRGYKAGVKKHAMMNEIDFAWQSRFYDHIIRSEKDLNNIRQYIIDNPAKWKEDEENLQGLWM